MNSFESTAQYLKEKGIKPSYQRVRVLDYMLQNKNHPTVDMLYSALSPEIPTLSKTTVYNTVNLFLEKGVVQLIGIDEQEMRYDADITTHAHFKCDRCGRILDLRLNSEGAIFQGIEGLKIREIQFYLKGLCQECQAVKKV
jgi:Fe2+ or Zn2+ uptake regulation protein